MTEGEAEIKVVILDEDLVLVGVRPEDVDLEEVADCFEDILQEEYFYRILCGALRAAGYHVEE